MRTQIRSSKLVSTGKFCTGIALIFSTLFTLSIPTAGDPKSFIATAATVDNYSITTSASANQVASLPRRIEIDLSQQRLQAWEGRRLVYSFRVSTGKRSTPTPIGRFHIQSKYRTHRMRGRGYDIANVPYAMYFYGGYAIHGAFWHNRFGTPVSHGCVNLPVKQARKLYQWAKPGTLVVVRR